MTVSIVVDIANRTKEEIEQIRTELASLGRDIDVTVDFKTRGFAKAYAQKKLLEDAFGTGPQADPGPIQTFINRLRKVRRTIGRFLPSWGMWIQLISMAIPVIVALSIELFGLAAAWGSVGIAAGAVVGLGLLGWGNNLQDSIAGARRQLTNLKNELYEVFRPAMVAFRPFSSRFLADLPDRLIPVAEALQGLRAFEGAIDRAFGGLVDWTTEALNGMAEYAPMLDQIAMRFGDLIGTGILNFLEWVTEELYRNQDTLINLGQSVIYIVAIIYNLSKIFGTLLTLLNPVFKALAAITRILSNPLVMAILSTVAAFVLLNKAYLLFLTMNSGGALMGIAKSFGMMIGPITYATKALWGMVVAMGTLRALATLGLSLAIGAAAYGYYNNMANRNAPGAQYGRPTGSMGGSTNITFNVNGQMDDATRHYIVSKVKEHQ